MDNLNTIDTILIEHLPDHLRHDPLIITLQNAYEDELSRLIDIRSNLLDQMFIETATELGLAYWERMLAVHNKSNDIVERRRELLAKIRSRQTSTVQVISSLVELFTGYKPSIAINHENYSYSITIHGYTEAPPNFIELVQAIDKINPSHLGITWRFGYNTHEYLGVDFNSNKTLEDYIHRLLTIYTHEQMKLSDLENVDVEIDKPKLGEYGQFTHEEMYSIDVVGLAGTVELDHKVIIDILRGKYTEETLLNKLKGE